MLIFFLCLARHNVAHVSSKSWWVHRSFIHADQITTLMHDLHYFMHVDCLAQKRPKDSSCKIRGWSIRFNARVLRKAINSMFFYVKNSSEKKLEIHYIFLALTWKYLKDSAYKTRNSVLLKCCLQSLNNLLFLFYTLGSKIQKTPQVWK